MRCDSCDVENRVERRFCRECGATLSRRCPDCGFANDPGDQFCGGCGIPLEERRAQPELPVSNRSERDEAVGSEAQRRQVTVLFCDLADSTSMSERLDSEDLSQLNRRYQEICSAVIEQFDGYVARYMGDGILCYFGYPVAHEDDAERALRAALCIQERLAAINDSGEFGQPLAVRIGIATGPTIVGEVVGSGSARESTAVGRTPNLAARLQGVAGPGHVVVAEDTMRLAGKMFVYRSLGKLELKGLSHPEAAWLVESQAAVGSRFEAIAGEQLTPFIGRQHERRLIEESWRQALEKRGQLLMFCGEAGIGKSRLLRVALELDEGRARVLQCSPHHQNSALYPIIEWLRGQLADTGADDASAIETLLADCGIHDTDAPTVLSRLIHGSEGAETGPGFDGPTLKKRFLDMSERLLTATPGVVAIEDLHWIDPTTEELVNTLAHRVGERRQLLLLSFRPEYRQSWSDLAQAQLVMLNRIAPEQCREMMRSLLVSELPERVVQEIIGRTDGIPLFVEELTRAVDAASRAGGVDRVEVPATLADSLNARLDRLGDARRTAQAASVIGRSFDRRLLAGITRIGDDDLDRQLTTLVDSGLVYRLGSGDAARFQFKHALIQDAAYASLLRERRNRFHLRAAHHLEELQSQGNQLAELLAYHFVRAGALDKGIFYSRLAGDVSLSTFSVTEALKHYGTALELLEQAPVIENASRAELDVQLGLAACHRFGDCYEEALACLERAEQLAEALEDFSALSDLCHTRGNIYFPTGNLDGCLDEHRRSHDYARRSGSLEREARAVGGLGDAYYLRGEMRRAQEMFDECCRLCENHGFDSLYAANRSMVGWSRLTALEFSEAADDALVAVDRCRTSGHLRGEMNAHALASYVLAEMNRHVEAQAHAREASSLARRLGTRNFDAAVAYFSFFSRDTGAGREAQYAMLQEAAETSRALGHGFHGPAILGGLLLVTDDPGEREEIVREAEATLSGACVGHNYFWFYRDAMQSALDHADWALLDRVRNRFLDIHRDSPTHWVTFYVQRINILERFRRGDVDGSVIDSCRDLIEEGRRHHLSTSLRELENALASVG